jgi:hypothetical protein
MFYFYYPLPKPLTIDTTESEEYSTSSRLTSSAADESGSLVETSGSFYSTDTITERTVDDSSVIENSEEADATPNVSPNGSGPSLPRPGSPVPPPRRSIRRHLPKAHFSPPD